MKTDAGGTKDWDRTFDGLAGGCGYSVRQTSEGGYLVVAVREDDLWLIKTDSEGHVS